MYAPEAADPSKGLPQEPMLFDATVAQNVAHGIRGAAPAVIAGAARTPDAQRFVLGMP